MLGYQTYTQRQDPYICKVGKIEILFNKLPQGFT